MYISAFSELETFIAQVRAEKFVAVDTEFVRDNTFYPKLCLVQLATPSTNALIDPILIENLSPLAELLKDESIVKIFHACSQDLEVLEYATGVVAHPIFDTQIAAGFLGHPHQLGLAPLVQLYEGVRLPKTVTLTDWAARPLDSEQLRYATDDVMYLPHIYQTMMQQLIEKDRLGWVMPEMESYCDASRWNIAPEEAYKRLKRSNSFTRRQLAIAREVCAWRERVAQKENRPRRWILSDETTIELCRLAPTTEHDVRRVRGTEHLSFAERLAILKALEAGRNCSAAWTPQTAERHQHNPAFESVLDLAYALLRIIADKSGVAISLIASRDDLRNFAEALYQKDAAAEKTASSTGAAAKRTSSRKKTTPPSRLSEGWRYELAGKTLESLFRGQTALTVKNGRLEIF